MPLLLGLPTVATQTSFNNMSTCLIYHHMVVRLGMCQSSVYILGNEQTTSSNTAKHLTFNEHLREKNTKGKTFHHSYFLKTRNEVLHHSL